MKITKIKTKGGEFRSPISTELGIIVERMRSDDIKDAADLIAKGCLHSRLAMKQGMPRYYLIDVDRLPYLMFGATFGKSGLDHPKTFTGLVMLNIPCPEGLRQVQEMKRRVRQIQFTLLAFAGVSGVTLKVLVKCEYKGSDTDDYLSFLKEAHESAARLYMSLVRCDLLVGEQRLVRGCRMSHDPQLYYNPEALLLPVVRGAQNPLLAYDGTKVDDDGTVICDPDTEAIQRIDLEFQTCLSKAIDDCEGDAERCLQLLADYCAMACLQEEGCVIRASWNSYFKQFGIDMVRKTFRNSYKKDPKFRSTLI